MTTATPDWMRNAMIKMASEKQAHESALKYNRPVITAALREAGITFVQIDFDGADDNGALLDPRYTKSERVEVDAAGVVSGAEWCKHPDGPDVAVLVVLVSPHIAIVKETKPITTAISTFAWYFLEAYHPGWENNGGASGFVWIDPRRDKAGLNISCRVIAYEDFDYEV